MAVRTSELIGLEWTDFLGWFTELWNPGEHASILAPTGGGKTTVAGGILSLRRFVAVIDPKGGDDTMDGFGYRRLPTWPGQRAMTRMLEEDERKGRPSHYIFGPRSNQLEDRPKIAKVALDTLVGAYNMGGWTVYCDELQLFCDPAILNCGRHVKDWLISARSGRRSFVSSFQAPSWVPTEALRQPTWVIASHTRDRDVIDRTAEIAGRPKEEVRGWMSELETYHWIVVPRNPRKPVAVTSPPPMS